MRPASIFLIIQLSNSREAAGKTHQQGSRDIAGVNYKKLFQGLLINYNPVFDSCWKKKSLYPLYLLGCRDFYRCFEL